MQKYFDKKHNAENLPLPLYLLLRTSPLLTPRDSLQHQKKLHLCFEGLNNGMQDKKSLVKIVAENANSQPPKYERKKLYRCGIGCNQLIP